MLPYTIFIFQCKGAFWCSKTVAVLTCFLFSSYCHSPVQAFSTNSFIEVFHVQEKSWILFQKCNFNLCNFNFTMTAFIISISFATKIQIVQCFLCKLIIYFCNCLWFICKSVIVLWWLFKYIFENLRLFAVGKLAHVATIIDKRQLVLKCNKIWSKQKWSRQKCFSIGILQVSLHFQDMLDG